MPLMNEERKELIRRIFIKEESIVDIDSGYREAVRDVIDIIQSMSEPQELDKPNKTGWWWIRSGKTTIPAKVVLNTDKKRKEFFEIWAWGMDGWYHVAEINEIFTNPKWQICPISEGINEP